MLLYLVRHGDPIYNPDSLTPLGRRQAEALAKRLALYGVDEVYTSPLERAKQTAAPTCELVKREMQGETWMSENLAWQDFSVLDTDGGHHWFFHSSKRLAMRDKTVFEAGMAWYDLPLFEGIHGKAGYERILAASDEFLARQGLVHDRDKRVYRMETPNEKRIAAFCHQGFGLSWLGVLLDLPLPLVWTSADMGHSGLTVIEFRPDADGVCAPVVLTMGNDSHLYREGLPTRYQNRLYF